MVITRACTNAFHESLVNARVSTTIGEVQKGLYLRHVNRVSHCFSLTFCDRVASGLGTEIHDLWSQAEGTNAPVLEMLE